MQELTSPRLGEKFIQAWIASHPLILYIGLAYSITYFAFFIAYRFAGIASAALFWVGQMGPALAGMIVSSLRRPEPSGLAPRNRWKLFLVLSACILALLVLRRLWLEMGLVTVTIRPAQDGTLPGFLDFLLDLLVAAITGFFLSGVLSPRQGIRLFMCTLDPRHQAARWYWFFLAVALYPAVILLGNGIAAAMGLPGPRRVAFGPWIWLLVDFLSWFPLVMLGGGGLEEPGWRGFALPELQKRHSPLVSSLIVGIAWAFWHLPMFLWAGWGNGPLGIFLFIPGCIAISFVFTVVYNRTRGSIAAAILLHTSINTIPIYLPLSPMSSNLWLLFCLSLGAWLWRSPALFQPPKVGTD